jgi:putative hydrolase of the HAD superfamily
MKSRYKHVFFDLDHTLWDFAKNSWETLAEVWKKFELYRLARIPLEEFRNRYEIQNKRLWIQYHRGQISKQELRETRFQKVMESFDADRFLDPYLLEEYYLDTCPFKTSLIDGSIEVLDYLVEMGYGLHILSNGFEETTIRKLESSEIKKYFENIITSEKLGVTKPQPEFFIKAMSISKTTPKETVMIGDNLSTDILGAQNAGIDQIYYNPKKSSHKESPTYEIIHLGEIQNIL